MRTAYDIVPIGANVVAVDTWSPQCVSVDETFAYIDIALVDRDTKSIAGTSRIRADEARSRARQIVRAGDVIVSTVRPHLNAVALVPETMTTALASAKFCVLRCNPGKLDHRYLFHWVRSRQFVADMVRQATGASYPAVSDRVIKESKIPLPPLPEQKRIADILDKADAIRRKRRQARALAQSISTALFRHTFNRYLTADSGHAILLEVADVVSGVAKRRNLMGVQTKKVPYLRGANVQQGYLDLSELNTFSAIASEIRELTLQCGDIVMAEGGDHDRLVRGAIWEEDIPACIHQDHVFRVRTNRTQLLPSFFMHYLQSDLANAYFLSCAKNTTNLASINLRQLHSLPVPLPPISLQLRFEHENGHLNRIIKVMGRTETESGHLLDSLVQHAFCGHRTTSSET